MCVCVCVCGNEWVDVDVVDWCVNMEEMVGFEPVHWQIDVASYTVMMLHG